MMTPDLIGQKSPGSKSAWLIISVILLGVFLLRFHLLALPLERDEGEYAYMAQLMLKGVPPYSQAYAMKLPGIYAIYAIILAVFGQTPTGIHLGLVAANMIAVVLVYMTARRFVSIPAALGAGACFAILSVSPWIQGVVANAEHFVIPAAMTGLLFLLKAVDTDKRGHLFLSGLFLGIALLIKQHGGAFLALACLYLLYIEAGKRPIYLKTALARFALLIGGAIIPFAIACLILKKYGVFDKFWFWTFTYAREYVSMHSFSAGLDNMMFSVKRIIPNTFFIWLIGLAGFCLTLFHNKGQAQPVFLRLLLYFSMLSVLPGFIFRDHYFLLLLPSVSLLCGITIQYLSDKLANVKVGRFLTLSIVVFGMSHSIYVQRGLLFKTDTAVASHLLYVGDPFPEAMEIGRYIKEHSTADDRVAVLGSEPEIFFYADRRTATGHIYMYPLLERQPYALMMQKEAITEIESSRPEFLIFVNIFTSWLSSLEFDATMLEWAPKYGKNYERVGVIDILSASQTRYYWGRDASFAGPKSGSRIFVYRKR